MYLILLVDNHPITIFPVDWYHQEYYNSIILKLLSIDYYYVTIYYNYIRYVVATICMKVHSYKRLELVYGT